MADLRDREIVIRDLFQCFDVGKKNPQTEGFEIILVFFFPFFLIAMRKMAIFRLKGFTKYSKVPF